jgi:hypoxanthine phosphoribosyltransferase
MDSTNREINYDYQTIHNLIRHGSIKVKSSGFKPDIILAIGGGGYIPSRILRTFIDIPVVAMTINYYDKNNKIQDFPNIIQMVDKDILNGKNVLIVDEVDDTRKTLGYIIDYFKQNKYNINTLGVFVINNKKKEKMYELTHDIHYFSCVDNKDVWIHYPWDNV